MNDQETNEDELTHRNIAEHRTDISGWVCRKCSRYWGNDERMCRYCCTNQNVCDCGELTEKYYSACKSCLEKLRIERERKCVESAKKMTLDEANACDGLFIKSDSYGFDGLAELVISHHDEPPEVSPERPLYVWATDVTPCSLDIEHALESMCDDHHEEFYDRLNGIDELNVAVDRFNKLNSDCRTFQPDYSRVYVVESLEQIGVSKDDF